jgi:hypothetical protein
MRFDRIKAEYFHRVEELRARFEEEMLRWRPTCWTIVNAS